MYNANQPRVPAGDRYGGRWTSGGAGGGPAGVRTANSAAMAVGVRELGVFAPAWITALSRMLAQLGVRAAGPIGVLGGLLIPANESQMAQGTLPGHPDIVYSFNGGVLTVLVNVPGDEKPLVFQGFPGDDGLYRLRDGTVIGRNLATGVLLNEIAIATVAIRTGEHVRSGAAANDDIKLCPDPGPDQPSTKTMSLEAKLYQQYITKLPVGMAVMLNGVMFDGCRTTDGVMLEAKGEGYGWSIQPDGATFDNYTGDLDIIIQMLKQSNAANDRLVEWHFAEKRAADYYKVVAETLKLPNIVVRHTLPPWRQQ